MRRVAATVALLAALVLAAPSRADVVVHIDKSGQRMTVRVDGVTAYQWAISTGRAGYNTPNGTFRPQRLARKWYSRKYHWSPMPYSVFFHGGYAIHGSYEIGRLGRPNSHGCIRLHPSHAARLFALVQQHGMGDTRIVITGSLPRSHYAGPRVKPKRVAAPRRRQL